MGKVEGAIDGTIMAYNALTAAVMGIEDKIPEIKLKREELGEHLLALFDLCRELQKTNEGGPSSF